MLTKLALAVETSRKFILVGALGVLFALSWISGVDAASCACYLVENDRQTCRQATVPDTGDVNIACESACNTTTQGQGTHLDIGTCPVQANQPAPSAEPLPSPIKFTKPILAIDIPGVSFSEPLRKGDKLSIPFLSEYISGLYKFLLGASLTIAIVMVMVGGVQYAVAGATGDVEAAKGRIKNAVTGLLLLFGVYVILYTVNPQLTLLRPIELELLRTLPESEPDSVQGTLATGFTHVSGENLIDWSTNGVAEEYVGTLEAVAAAIKGDGYAVLITSTFRSYEEQVALINRNCQNPPGSKTCDPKPGRPQTCILQGNKAESCPHTTGRAMDIWGAEKNPKDRWQQCVNLDTCIANKKTCFEDPCQKALISAMKAQGFCVLSSEPWHFEKPKMSSNCN